MSDMQRLVEALAEEQERLTMAASWNYDSIEVRILDLLSESLGRIAVALQADEVTD